MSRFSRVVIGTLVLAALAFFCSCAGLSGSIQETKMGSDEGGEAPKVRVVFGPTVPELSGAVVKKLSPEQLETVLKAQMAAAVAFAQATAAATYWVDLSLMNQSIGATQTSEGDLNAQLRAMVAQKLTAAGEGGTE